MSDKKQSTKQEPPPTIITLTLSTPSEGGIPLERATATLLIQRGDLAHIRQFTAATLSCSLAGCTSTRSNQPWVSTAICRLHPLRRL